MSRRQKLKARDKIVRKMSKDGLTLHNNATGEDIFVSKREMNADFKVGNRSGDTFLQLAKRSDENQINRKKQKQRRIIEHFAKAENVANIIVQPPKSIANDYVLKQMETTIFSQPETFESEEILHGEVTHEQQTHNNKEKPLDPHHIPKKPMLFNHKSSVVVSEMKNYPQKATENQPSSLKHDSDSRLQFEHINQATPTKQHKKKSAQNYKPEFAEQADNIFVSSLFPSIESKLEAIPSEPQHDKSERLLFEPQIESADSQPSLKMALNQTKTPISDRNVPVFPATPPPIVPPPEKPLTHNKSTKLNFNEAEKTPTRGEIRQQRKHGKAEKRVEQAVTKLENAQAKLPSKRKVRAERVFNEENGKAKHKLTFENEVKSQGEHMKGALPLRPVKMAGNSALAFGHRKMFQVQHENVGTQAAHKGEMMAEAGVRVALHSRKTAPYRKIAKLEHKVQQKSINAAYQKTLAENPKLKSNFVSRAFQKRKIKKEYAKSAREAKKAAKRAKKAGSVTSQAAKIIATAVRRHPIVSLVIVLILLLMFGLMSIISAFGGLGSGGLATILTSSYLAEDVDIDAAELAYTEWETDLQFEIANAEATHTGYDEYRYNVSDISHNPYELMALLTVLNQNFTFDSVSTELRALFDEQYNLAFTPTIETKYADPDDANDDGDYEPYEWKVLTVGLTARSFSDVAMAHLSGEQLAHFALLLQTKGSRQFVANPFGDVNWLPYVTSYYGYRIHPISGEKDLHRGVDIAFPTGTEIKSGLDGTVTFAGNSGGYGNVIVIENDKGIVAKYAHCDTLLFSTGQTVKIGDVIATVGNTGNSTGSHLHLEVLKNGTYLNPSYFADTGSFNAEPDFTNPGEPMGDGTYAALIAEGEKHLGKPYVFGANGPNSFDCSSFICYILTNSGVKSTPRTTTQGIYNQSQPVHESDRKPGDLVFFHSTYSTSNTVTHIGLYVGNGFMLHAGSPVQYTKIDGNSYWQTHLYGYGRISSD